jgi:hypothetical protein
LAKRRDWSSVEERAAANEALNVTLIFAERKCNECAEAFAAIACDRPRRSPSGTQIGQ